MKFATIGHLLTEENLRQLPQEWIQGNLIVAPELNIHGTKGVLTGLLLTAKQMMEQPLEKVRKNVLDAAVFLQNNYNVDLVQLGALTTSVTSGGLWLIDQKEYTGYVNHGDSYTASITCQTVHKGLQMFNKKPKDTFLAIVGAYGVIGEAVSKILVPEFSNTLLVGRREEKLKELAQQIKGRFETTTELTKIKDADIVVTATSHPTALLHSQHLKKNAIVVDVSQPPNVSPETCQKRPDICRIDGGFVDFPIEYYRPIPGIPKGKNLACIVEVIMQAMENERKNHVGSIDLKHLKKTEKWGKKYGFILNELTNFGTKIMKC